jgi:hypothetical protein
MLEKCEQCILQQTALDMSILYAPIAVIKLTERSAEQFCGSNLFN